MKKEIDKIRDELEQTIKDLDWEVEYRGERIKTLRAERDKLQIENDKLKEALVYIAKVYDRPTDVKVRARHVLAELDETE